MIVTKLGIENLSSPVIRFTNQVQIKMNKYGQKYSRKFSLVRRITRSQEYLQTQVLFFVRTGVRFQRSKRHRVLITTVDTLHPQPIKILLRWKILSVKFRLEIE